MPFLIDIIKAVIGWPVGNKKNYKNKTDFSFPLL